MKAFNSLYLFAGVLTATICAAGAQSSVAAPTQAEIRTLEASVVLPPGASPLSKYNRHYAVVVQGSIRHILGVYIGDGGKLYVTTPEKLPRVLDGGCGVVNVEYDVTTNRFLSVTCNGEA